MPWPRACLALSIAFLATPIDASAAYQPPSASLLNEIRRQHAPKDWWIVTTDSTRYVVQVGKIGDDALSRLKPGHGTKSAPDPLQWSSISRVDLRKSKFLSRRIQGVVLGAIVGGLLPVAFGAEGDPGTELGLLVGAAAGGWLGGLYGDQLTHEQTLYVSPSLVTPRTSAAEVPADTSMAEAPADTSSDTLRVSTTVTTTPAIRAACEQIDDDDLLRIHADFGTFEGFASGADSTGLSGLRARSAPGAEAFPALLSWDRVQTVEIRGNNGRHGAIKGGVTLGAIGAIGGMLAIFGASTSGNSSANPSASWVLEPAFIGAVAGAIIGGVTGSMKVVWRRVYP
jgi:hypothetical protein